MGGGVELWKSHLTWTCTSIKWEWDLIATAVFSNSNVLSLPHQILKTNSYDLSVIWPLKASCFPKGQERSSYKHTLKGSIRGLQTPTSASENVIILMMITVVDYHFPLQGIFQTQGSNSCLLNWQADSSPLNHLESPDDDYYLLITKYVQVTVLMQLWAHSAFRTTLLLFPFYRWRNWGPASLSNCPISNI